MTHRVVALVHPPQAPFELAIAGEVFGTDRPDVEARYSFEVCALRPGRTATLTGYAIDVETGLDAIARADTVVIPGWQTHDDPAPSAVLDALRAAHRRGARQVAICSGAFLLAEAGLLRGRRATTHWRLVDKLAAQHPDVEVDPDVLYVDNGDVATSAGTAAGVDLCLHIVRQDHGAAYAADVARQMVMPPHREGGQAQFAPLVTSRHRVPDGLAAVQDWALERIDDDLTVEALARRAGMSSRTFTRRFTADVGESPGQWLLVKRVNAARELLEVSDDTVEAIARQVGLGAAVNFRRHFQRLNGTTPAAYRRAFRDVPR